MSFRTPVRIGPAFVRPGRCAIVVDIFPARRPTNDEGAIPMGEITIALNRRARHEYTIDETFEAGIVLTGTEIKSVRANKVNLSSAYARVERNEAWLIGAHIAPYEQASRENHEAKRTRKLLLHRSEIEQIMGRAKQKGQTIVPLRLYISQRGRAKIELGLARGKNLHDKRRDIADREAKRDVAREVAEARKG
jgi:SsrA-binding protein